MQASPMRPAWRRGDLTWGITPRSGPFQTVGAAGGISP